MPVLLWANEVRVNSKVAGFQEKPQVAALANGGFVVVWHDYDPQRCRRQLGRLRPDL